MRVGHEVLKMRAGQSAAGGLLHRMAVVVADPHAADQIGGEADEPGIAEVLRGAGLAGARAGRPARAARAGSGGHGLAQHRRHLGGFVLAPMTRPMPEPRLRW